MDRGYFLLHRRIFDKLIKKPFTPFEAWVHLISLATHKNRSFFTRGIDIKLKRGQIGITMKGYSDLWGWSRSKTKRFLKHLENEHQIELEINQLGSIVTILNYEKYQQVEHQTNIKRTSNEHQTNTVKTIINNVEQKRLTTLSSKRHQFDEIITALNQATGKKFKPTTAKTQSLIKARLKEGFTVQDFLTVIENKTEQWGHDEKMSPYLRPQTLFSDKFEGYLNENEAGGSTQTEAQIKKQRAEFKQHMANLNKLPAPIGDR